MAKTTKLTSVPPKKPTANKPAAKKPSEPAIDWERIRMHKIRCMHAFPGLLIGHVTKETDKYMHFWAPALIKMSVQGIMFAPIMGVQAEFIFTKASAFGESAAHPLLVEKYKAYVEEFIAGNCDINAMVQDVGPLKRVPVLDGSEASEMAVSDLFKTAAKTTTPANGVGGGPANDTEAPADPAASEASGSCPSIEQGDPTGSSEK